MRENVSLKPFNTFGLEAGAKYFEEINNEDEVLNLLHQERFGAMPLLILGGGSNVLFTQDFDGLVLLNRLKGIKILNETDSEILLEVASGEVWHDFVLHAVKNGWSGIENLSLIPGTVGAAPMQNIGAYGVEVKNVIEQVRYLVLDTLQIETLNAAACEFGYRESVFKHDLKGKVFILSVQFRLSKGAFIPQISYGAIQETLAEKQITNPSIQEVSEAVIAIRQSKLPDPAVLGNSGSFFKNPEIPEAQFNELKKKFETLPSYPTTPGFDPQKWCPSPWTLPQVASLINLDPLGDSFMGVTLLFWATHRRTHLPQAQSLLPCTPPPVQLPHKLVGKSRESS